MPLAHMIRKRRRAVSRTSQRTWASEAACPTKTLAQHKREPTMRSATLLASLAMLFTAVDWLPQSIAAAQKKTTVETLQTEIEALKAPRVAWREIAWKSCLID